MSTATFISERKKSIGGTDVAAICGVNPYKTQFDVYNEKVNGYNVEENDAMRLGKAFEPAIAKLFSQATSLPVFSPAENTKELRAMIEDDEVRFVDVDFQGEKVTILKRGVTHGSLDYFTIDYDGQPAVVECKLVTNNFFKSKEEFIKTNPHYYMQVQWYMYVTGFRKAYFATVQFKFGGHIEWYPIEYNEKLIEIALQKVNNFVDNYLSKGVMPPPTNPEELNKFIDYKVEGDFAVADDDILEAYTQLTEIKDRIKELDKNKSFLEDKIKMAIYDKEGIKTKDELILATYKVQNRKSFDSKAFKEDNPDEYLKYEKQTQVRVLLIK